MKLGAEPKKMMFLGGLVAVALAIYFWPSSDERQDAAAEASKEARRPGGAAANPVISREAKNSTVLDKAPGPTISRAARIAQGRSAQGFSPKYPGKDEPIAPDKVDPTLHLEVLDKLQNVKMAGGARSLFEFAQAPLPTDIPPVGPIKVAGRGYSHPRPIGPDPAPVPQPPPPPPPPPPITLKYYGFINPRNPNIKRAFFLDGEDIFVAAEGETVKRHYRIVRIGVNSAVVEDTDNKHQQTLPLEEQAG